MPLLQPHFCFACEADFVVRIAEALFHVDQSFVVDQDIHEIDIREIEESRSLFGGQSDKEKVIGVVRWLSCLVVVWWTTCICGVGAITIR